MKGIANAAVYRRAKTVYRRAKTAFRRGRAFSVPIKSERGSISFFDAFSSREPVSTSLEN
jgi:hypothetical protein